ncbi:NUDIX domain-containing protein [Candidatus Saccharibacteria bacterium]|nr:NUDIX domain-containing protein [Candidatus Saccharibacteria bacterium]
MSNGSLTTVPSVFAAVIKDGKALLIRRANTGWMDGYYDLPAGHLEDQEHLKDGALRELKEETGITAEPVDLKLIHVHQNHHRPDFPHYGYIFLVKKWCGEPKLMEPNKADDIGFFALDNLPKKITPYSKMALDALGSDEVTISYHAPGSINTDV